MDSESVSVSLLYPVMKTMMRRGLNWDDFCQYASIDPALPLNPEARIASDELERTVKAAAEYTDDAFFGLHQGQSMIISDLGVLGYVMLHSGTIGQALTAYQKYNFIVCSGFGAEYKVQGEDVVIALFLSRSPQAPGRHCIEDMTTSFHQTLQALSAGPLPIKAVEFMHQEPPGSEEYPAVLGVMPQFTQSANTLRFHKEILDYPVLGADVRLLGVFEAIAEEVRVKLTQGSVLTGELYRWVIECMPTFFPTLQDAAIQMRMSVRTLQAKLKSENTSYNRLANEVRKELALRYLAKPEYTIAEIAYLLHFSEPSAFQTAFRKWTGKAPGEYRQRVEVQV